jgi:predicted GNAT family acetyltransferase
MTEATGATEAAVEPAVELSKNTELGRYELRLDGVVVSFADYDERDGVVAIPHTETDAGYGGRGLAAQVVRFALADIAAAGHKVDPACPYVAAYINKNAEFKPLVA